MKIGSGETSNPIWQLLKIPKLYDLVQHVAGTDRVHREFVDRYVRPHKGARVLDLGCGTGDLLACFNDVEYIGIDFNEDYVSVARQRYAGKGSFLFGDATRFSEKVTGQFEFIVAVGLLHHLNDPGASRLLSSLPSVLAPAGKFVSVDPCYDSSQNALQRWMVSKDRGRAVRTPSGYRELFPPHFTVEHRIRHNWGNIPWTHCILTAIEKHPPGFSQRTD
jgi:SAM-dependent methyltransferase